MLVPAYGTLVSLGWARPEESIGRFHFLCSSFMPYLLPYLLPLPGLPGLPYLPPP